MNITMCKGKGCPYKDGCLRYTAKPNEYRQSYFATIPLKEIPVSVASQRIIEGDCDYYIPNKEW